MAQFYAALRHGVTSRDATFHEHLWQRLGLEPSIRPATVSPSTPAAPGCVYVTPEPEQLACHLDDVVKSLTKNCRQDNSST